MEGGESKVVWVVAVDRASGEGASWSLERPRSLVSRRLSVEVGCRRRVVLEASAVGTVPLSEVTIGK